MSRSTSNLKLLGKERLSSSRKSAPDDQGGVKLWKVQPEIRVFGDDEDTLKQQKNTSTEPSCKGKEVYEKKGEI